MTRATKGSPPLSDADVLRSAIGSVGTHLAVADTRKDALSPPASATLGVAESFNGRRNRRREEIVYAIMFTLSLFLQHGLPVDDDDVGDEEEEGAPADGAVVLDHREAVEPPVHAAPTSESQRSHGRVTAEREAT